MFAPSPSLHFLVHLSFLFITVNPLLHPGFTVFKVASHRKRIPKSMQRNLLLTPLHLKLKKIQGLFKDLHRNSRPFQGKMEFKDVSRTPPEIQGLFKTVRTLELVLPCVFFHLLPNTLVSHTLVSCTLVSCMVYTNAVSK